MLKAILPLVNGEGVTKLEWKNLRLKGRTTIMAKQQSQIR